MFVFKFITQFILLCSLLQEGKSGQIQSLREKDICIGMQPSPVFDIRVWARIQLVVTNLYPIQSHIANKPLVCCSYRIVRPRRFTPPSSPSASFTVPTCPRTEFAPPGLNLPAPDHTLSTLRNRNVLAAVLPETPTTTSTQTVEQYPLKEGGVLCWNSSHSVRVDMIQTAILVNYIQDFLKRL